MNFVLIVTRYWPDFRDPSKFRSQQELFTADRKPVLYDTLQSATDAAKHLKQMYESTKKNRNEQKSPDFQPMAVDKFMATLLGKKWANEIRKARTQKTRRSAAHLMLAHLVENGVDFSFNGRHVVPGATLSASRRNIQ